MEKFRDHVDAEIVFADKSLENGDINCCIRTSRTLPCAETGHNLSTDPRSLADVENWLEKERRA